MENEVHYDVLIEIEASSKYIDAITCFINYSLSSEMVKNFLCHFITDFCEHLKTHHIIDDFALSEAQKGG